MSAKHTPGPWRIVETPYRVAVYPEGDRPGPYGGHTIFVRECNHDSDRRPTVLANARLAVAAPEVADLLREARMYALGTDCSTKALIGRIDALLASLEVESTGPDGGPHDD